MNLAYIFMCYPELRDRLLVLANLGQAHLGSLALKET